MFRIDLQNCLRQWNIIYMDVQEDKFALARKRMVEFDLKGRDITDPYVL
jgi:hypothetical protein